MSRAGYRQVSLRDQTVDKLQTAKAWLSGDRGKTATLSDTVEQLIEWYEDARTKHTCSEEDCDQCGYERWLSRRDED